MTIVKNEIADAWVRMPQKEFRFFLLHGTDQGLTHERSATLVRSLLGNKADPFSLTRISGESILREPGVLADEAYAVPMLGDQRVLWIDAKSRDLAGAIDPLIADPPTQSWLIVEAGNLKKASRLRTAFERSGNAISIECYPDDRRSLIDLIDGEARAAGIEVSLDARNHLSSLLGADRMTTRGELAKLMLYANGSRRIELADVEAIVSNGAPSGLTEVIDRSLLGEIAEVERLGGRFFQDGGDPGQLIMRLASQLTLLHNLELEVEMGNSREAALQKHLARSAPSGRASIGKQADRWTLAALVQKLPSVQKALSRVRGDPKIGQSLAIRALWALALSSRSGHDR